MWLLQVLLTPTDVKRSFWRYLCGRRKKKTQFTEPDWDVLQGLDTLLWQSLICAYLGLKNKVYRQVPATGDKGCFHLLILLHFKVSEGKAEATSGFLTGEINGRNAEKFHVSGSKRISCNEHKHVFSDTRPEVRPKHKPHLLKNEIKHNFCCCNDYMTFCLWRSIGLNFMLLLL